MIKWCLAGDFKSPNFAQCHFFPQTDVLWMILPDVLRTNVRCHPDDFFSQKSDVFQMIHLVGEGFDVNKMSLF